MESWGPGLSRFHAIYHNRLEAGLQHTIKLVGVTVE
ncbi:hypothetical protein Q31b_44080 [Novipirellula aureliae]|uniref:Uncharacterized protein n=1 Tax=Novipirellula aureliae TaxID=2527966 RepID=A0A5C6DLD0_9BACT|nr:hypothetical protein Q31b_44080 [Novipirellula aureliae]